MANLKAPSVNIAFYEIASSAIERGDRGIVVIAIKESTPIDVTEVFSVADIPSGLSEFNKEQIKFALQGYNTVPKKVIVYCMDSDESVETEYTKMFTTLETYKWNYFVCPTVETDGKTSDVSSWIKTNRENHKLYKAVLPNITADSEGIVNVASKLYKGATEYTAEQICSRVAGLIAGTSMTISCTYAPLFDFTDCERLTTAQEDAAVTAGKLVFMNDGEKVKIVRGVNSFTTTTDQKNDSFKKIKLVEAMDMIADDIRKTAQDSYLGKYANSYNNKCLLISAINAYFSELVTDGILESGYCSIDIDGNKNYLKGRGIDVTEMSDDEIKKANTGANVYLKANIVILDAIEEITLDIYI